MDSSPQQKIGLSRINNFKQLKDFRTDEMIQYKSPFNKNHIEVLKSMIDSGSILIAKEDGTVLLDYYSNDKLIPASTLKVITSAAVLHIFGADYRFKTEFRLDSSNNLFIKGYGDPYLTSDEIRLIIKKLISLGLNQINSIYLNDSFFADTIHVPGNESHEAYTAINTSLAANFNTIAFKKKGTELIKGEEETPIVDYAKVILDKINNQVIWKGDNLRISIKNKEDSLLYFGHLFKELCKEENIVVNGEVKIGKSVIQKAFYTHLSSKTMSDIVKILMQYSNNFTANQLLLLLGTKLKEPATLQDGIIVLQDFIKNTLKINGIRIKEGSGLSYANRVTARQMIRVLDFFKPYKKLLKHFNENLYAKSGGLQTVSSLVGFFNTKQQGEVKFAIILNQSLTSKPHSILYEGILKIIDDTLNK